MLRSGFKSASFSSSCKINYDFKAEMSPFTKWVTDKSSRVQRNCNKQRNMATRKMNFYPRFCFLLSPSHFIIASLILPLITVGGTQEREQTQLYPMGLVHTEWCQERKRHHLLLLRPVRLLHWAAGLRPYGAGWPRLEDQAWGWWSGPTATWKCPTEASCEVPQNKTFQVTWGSTGPAATSHCITLSVSSLRWSFF